MSSFYKRPLPDGCLAFSSDEGRALFREALHGGTMEGFFALAEQFHTQAEPAFCGLATLVVVLNAMSIDPGRAWRGPWRWYAEELLDCCRSLDDVKKDGVTLAQLACLARCNGAKTEVFFADASSEEALRAAIRVATSSPHEPHVVVGYDRATLGQTGSGHFSPVGGYHAGRDLVLLLDVARFKYPPHWVPLSQLFRAMLPVDGASRRSRGFVIVRKEATSPFVPLRADATWDEIARFLADLDGTDLHLLSRCVHEGGGSGARVLEMLAHPEGAPEGARAQLERLRAQLADIARSPAEAGR